MTLRKTLLEEKAKILKKDFITLEDEKILDSIELALDNLQDKGMYFDKEKFIPKRLADEIIKKHYFKTTNDTEEVLFYNNGIYHDGGETIIKKEVEVALGEDAKTYYVNEVIGHIQRSTYFDRKEMNPVNLLCLKNGIYNIETNKLQEHNPNIIFTIKLPIKYNPKAKPKYFLKFLNEVMNKEYISMIQEKFGYCLYRRYSIKKLFLLFGETDAGKTIYFTILKNFIGEENISGIPLQNLGKRFQIINLYHKHVNLVDDISAREIKDVGMVKMATGESLLFGEKKNVQKQIPFVNFAKMIFSCNKIPPVDENTDDAYFNRIIVIPFPFRFVENPKEPNEKRKISRQKLEAELLLEKEMSGIFNWSIIGLKRLLKQDRFTNEKTIDEKREEYISLTDPITSFFNEMLELDLESETSKEEIFLKYVDFCIKNNFVSVGRVSFFMKFKEKYAKEFLENRLIELRKTDKRIYAIKGIKVKGEKNIQKTLS